MLTLTGLHLDWSLKVYGVFSSYSFNYPLLSLSSGVLNLPHLKERFIPPDPLNPLTYSLPFLILKAELPNETLLFKIPSSLKITISYLLEPTDSSKTIDVEASVLSLISIPSDRPDLYQRIYSSIKELLRPPTFIEHQGSILYFNNGLYLPNQESTL